MPARNRIKVYGEGEYYHVYNRGVNKEDIFREESDYVYFLSLFKRHLSSEDITDKYGRSYKNFADAVELVTFCLMPNHYHLLFYLKQSDGLAKFMQGTMTAYTMYFNKKYRRSGSLYGGIFLASRITTDLYFWHVSRYIHLNPLDIGEDFRSYSFSSLPYFMGEKHAMWLHEERLVETEKERKDYVEFVADYEDMHKDMKLLKNLLAAE